MFNTWFHQKACQHCRRPVLETHNDYLYCPTCDTTYCEHDMLSNELKVISGPSVDVFETNVNLILQKGGPYRDESGQWRLTRLLDKFGIDSGALTERWIFAASHLWYLYYISQMRAKYPNSQHMLLPSQTRPLRSKLSTSGYFFTYLRPGISPFTFLSNDSFMIIMSSSYNPKAKYPFIPRSNERNLHYYLNEEYRQVNWQKGIEGLLAAGLIEEAHFETNLGLLTMEKIRQKLKEYGKGDAGKKVRKSIDQTIPVLMRNSLSPFHRKSKRGRWFQNDLDIFYLLQLIVKNIKIHFQYSMQR